MPVSCAERRQPGRARELDGGVETPRDTRALGALPVKQFRGCTLSTIVASRGQAGLWFLFESELALQISNYLTEGGRSAYRAHSTSLIHYGLIPVNSLAGIESAHVEMPSQA